MRQLGVMFLLLMIVLTSVGGAADTWPEWRGVDGQGHAIAKNLPTHWSEAKNVEWKTAIPGLGWSTPVIWDGRIWVTTAIDTPATAEEAKERRKTTDNSQPLTISKSVSLRAVCVDLKSGEILHNVQLLAETDPQMIHYKNSYATPTPIVEMDRLYCHYGPYGLACLDTTNCKVLWTNQELRVKHENGPGSSPVSWKNLLIIHCDGIDKQYIVAVDKTTGKIKWKTLRTGELNSNAQLRKSYATSLIVAVDGSPQVISPAADWVYGYDPDTGKELWKLQYGQLGFSNAPRPVAGHGMVYICTGYMKSQLLAIKPGTAARKPKVAWRFSKQVPNVSSPILIGSELYFASDNGIATCLDASTGSPIWTERIGKKFWSSPIYADGRLYIADVDGVTTVIKPGRKFNKVAKNSLDGTLFATPIAIDNALILRTDKALYRLN